MAPWHRYAFASLLVLPFACGASTPDLNESRVLDAACAQATSCPVDGPGARRTSGFTADSVGFRLGPEQGQVTIMVPPLELPPGHDRWIFQVLARGQGDFDVPSCVVLEPAGSDTPKGHVLPNCVVSGHPTATYDWMTVGAAAQGTFHQTPETTLVLRVPGDGSTLDLVDIRIVSSASPVGGGGCN